MECSKSILLKKQKSILWLEKKKGGIESVQEHPQHPRAPRDRPALPLLPERELITRFG